MFEEDESEDEALGEVDGSEGEDLLKDKQSENKHLSEEMRRIIRAKKKKSLEENEESNFSIIREKIKLA